MRLRLLRLSCSALLAFIVCGCRSTQEERAIDVIVSADGGETAYSFSRELTVDQVLAAARIELGARDRISHPLVSPVVDGMRVTVRRVAEKALCEQEEIAYQRLLRPKEGLPEGKREAGAGGVTGLREVCYRIVLEDETEVERVQVGRPTVVRAPVDEIVYIGVRSEVAPISIAGRLSYINHGEAWTITGDASNKRRLTANHNLDGLVFQQRQDGSRLIFTGESDASDEFFNELWLIDTGDPAQSARMTPTDVLFAAWRPRTRNEIAYSTGERRAGTADWKALNNLWLMRIDLESGRTVSIKEVLPESGGGLYGWRGRNLAWSPDGGKMAWAQADGFGLVDFESKRLKPLIQYAAFHSAASWVWLSPLSWSFDGRLLTGIVHGAPLGDEPAERSPIFDLVVASAEGLFSASMSASAGMWAAPAFSPDLSPPGAEFSRGYLSWLQAREPRNSLSSEYDLMVADRDGSNPRRLFPPPGEKGWRKRDYGSVARDYAWSPDGRFIALIHEGDLWLVDIETAAPTRVTFDGQTSNPVWTG